MGLVIRKGGGGGGTQIRTICRRPGVASFDQNSEGRGGFGQNVEKDILNIYKCHNKFCFR